jgi:hypothetical protein
MKLEPQILIDAAAIRGELCDMVTAGVCVLLCLAIAWAIAELRKL